MNTKDAGKDIAEGAEKSAKVTVYYTEDAGHKVAHFFKRSSLAARCCRPSNPVRTVQDAATIPDLKYGIEPAIGIEFK